jgi:hypothetical protein
MRRYGHSVVYPDRAQPSAGAVLELPGMPDGVSLGDLDDEMTVS